ncbi:pyruvate kinase [Trichosporon asahii var. asahii CBS 2479]|uniref:Pyruvate kinase n=1 Tax=Trichosporon asahii var. asahii (strain ATCC 90039 / CBS 2479 / JCM 2466 / KCTC 7840 / NBRC 103889/ NCYC 2677 / UAMH 7654) TaxID=1186058 RepID=J5RFE7_TRIAS|nr:pyruvate kinase [Trichosporon asahii var. asahii CBS 2479]EJT52353.1 pyruvate kinase [Trichosporon asahii var. asahii CBS 2479]
MPLTPHSPGSASSFVYNSAGQNLAHNFESRNPMSSSQISWLAGLSTSFDAPTDEQKYLRKTSIIATIGPKVNNVPTLVALADAGMNIVRMNFSHGSYEYHQSVIDNTREADKQLAERPLAIALDTKGPEIRTGLMTNDQDVPIPAGHEFWVTTDPAYKESGTADMIYMDYTNLPKVTAPGKLIYVDDGILSLQVISIDGDKLRVKSLNSGTLSSRKGVNLPKTPVDLPPLSEKDKSDLAFGVKNGIDMIFASFIRRADDVREIRKVLGQLGASIKIIVKIENEQGVTNFDEILAEADGVMVARGDLGIEIPASQVFLAQKMMIAKCNVAGKPVICATQMLESMTVSDVANAVLDGADCVMLSGETAKGKYPIEAVKMMAETAYLAESAISYNGLFDQLRQLTPRPTETAETLALSAVAASIEQDAGAIIVLSTSGVSARLISKYRPKCPIICVTRNAATARQLHLSRGVYPVFYPEPRGVPAEKWQIDVDNRIRYGLKVALHLNIIRPEATTNTLRILSVPTDPSDLEIAYIDRDESIHYYA